MAQLTADEVLTQQHVRGFIAYGPAQPGTSAEYYGVKNQYFSVTGISNPVTGGISPITMPDPGRRKRYKRVGKQVDAPDFGEYELAIAMKHFTLPKSLGALDCPITVWLSSGRCKNPSDLNRGYESWVYILANGDVTDRDLGDMFPSDSDDALMATLSVVTSEQYAVGSLLFGATAASEVTTEVLDVVYASPRDCDTCSGGAQRIYAVTRPASGGRTVVVSSSNGGATWQTSTVSTMAVDAVPTAIAVMGQYVVVLGETQPVYYFAELDADTGTPGTWSNSVTVFQGAGHTNDMYVLAPNDAVVVGNGGYIYRLTGIGFGNAVRVLSAGSATTANLRRIHGVGETMVAVGAGGAIVVSNDRGVSWLPAPSSPTSADLTAIAVKHEKHFWIGSADGKVWYTITGGKTWVEATSAVAPGALAIQDIVFATDHVGYCAYTVTGPVARLSTTIDAGDTWVVGAARVTGTFPTFPRCNRVAAPTSDAPQTDANAVVLGGLGSGTDGAIFVGRANEV